MMNIYLVKRKDWNDYIEPAWDSYDSFICAANSKQEAMSLEPHRSIQYNENQRAWIEPDCWIENKTEETLEVILLGQTDLYFSPTVLLSSYNAG